MTAAYAAQNAALIDWLERLPPQDWEQPSRLPGWTVRELGFHATDMTAVVVRALAGGGMKQTPLSIAKYTEAWREAADEIAARDRASARDIEPAGVIANARSARADVLAALAAVTGDPVVAARRGPLRLTDLMVTRVNEAVVHSIDLSASVPDREPVQMDRQALGVACRMLTGILGERVPGHSVELRVPPYSAVQCVEGPRHTRGTPPNVVEVDAMTWIELATGRVGWAAALADGRLRTSGERADISEHLPVLA